MKSIVLALILCAGWIQAADETTDREAIRRTVYRLNSFTADFDNDSELARLRSAPVTVQPLADRPGEVIISSEPWGEATISIPGVRFVAIKRIRFLTPEVALVDAQSRFPVLFVLRKEGATWKIASLRILAEN